MRQRDGLPNGDLDRTHRQQAFLDSVIHQLRAEGVLSDLTKLDALLSVARQYAITDAGWNLLDFATEMRSLSSGNLVFHTLPIKGFATIDGQDANVIDPAYITSIVRGTFYPKPSPPQRPSPRPHRQPGDHRRRAERREHNGAGRAGRGGPGGGGVPGRTGREHQCSRQHRGPLRAGNVGPGRPIAALFGVTAVASGSVPPHQVEILLGGSATLPHIPVSAPAGRRRARSSPPPGRKVARSWPRTAFPA